MFRLLLELVLAEIGCSFGVSMSRCSLLLRCTHNLLLLELYVWIWSRYTINHGFCSYLYENENFRGKCWIHRNSNLSGSYFVRSFRKIKESALKCSRNLEIMSKLKFDQLLGNTLILFQTPSLCMKYTSFQIIQVVRSILCYIPGAFTLFTWLLLCSQGIHEKTIEKHKHQGFFKLGPLQCTMA